LGAGEAGLSGKVGTQDFTGALSALDRAPASGSLDPIDYFTRLGPSDNLFKVVERRYQTTASNWASQQALEISKAKH
jgi:hypothetical protein